MFRVKQAWQQDRCDVFYKVMILYHCALCTCQKELRQRIETAYLKEWRVILLYENMFQQELIPGVARAPGVRVGDLAVPRAGFSILIT